MNLTWRLKVSDYETKKLMRAVEGEFIDNFNAGNYDRCLSILKSGWHLKNLGRYDEDTRWQYYTYCVFAVITRSSLFVKDSESVEILYQCLELLHEGLDPPIEYVVAAIIYTLRHSDSIRALKPLYHALYKCNEKNPFRWTRDLIED